MIGCDSKKAAPRTESDFDGTYRKHAKAIEIEHAKCEWLEVMITVCTYMKKQQKQSEKNFGVDEIEHAKC